MSKSIDEKKEVQLLQKLADFGLDEKAARVYLALLPHQDIGSSKLIYATGLHGQFVYDALERLEKQGLARHVIQNGRKKFSANTPIRILSILEEKRVSAQSVVRELQDRFGGAHEQDFEIYQGENAFIAHEFATLEEAPEGSRLDVIAGSRDQYFVTIGEQQEEYEQLRIKKNITIRYIGGEPKRELLAEWAKWRKLWTYRIFPGLATGVVDTDIWWNSIHFNVFGNPMLSFELKGKDVADGYREFFEALWSVSKK